MTAADEPDLTWMQDAACRGWPQTWWYPEKNTSAQQAIRICNTCPVRDTCLNHALNTPEPDGVWGGQSAAARELTLRIRRNQTNTRTPSPIRHGTLGGYSAHIRRGEQPCDACRREHNWRAAAARRHRRTQEET